MRRTAMIAALLAAGQLAGAASGCAMPDEPKRAFVLAGPTILERGRTTVPVRLERNAASAAGRPMLVIEGLSYDSPPGVMYEVYLQGRSGRRALLGVINFYNQGAGGYGGIDPAPSVRPGSHSFDATAALRAVGGGPAALVFEPTAGVAGPGVKAVVNPAARVRFRSATLELR